MFADTLHKIRDQWDSAYTSRNITECLRLLQNGAVFAIISIRTKTSIAERRYAQFIWGGRKHHGIKGLMTSQRNAIDSILSLTWHDWQGVVSSPFPELELSWKVYGLGITKASFALACSGFGRLGCIDSRIQKQNAGLLTPIIGKNGKKIQGKTRKAYKTYLKALEILYPGSHDYALSQWESWLEEFNASESFKTTHEVLTHYA